MSVPVRPRFDGPVTARIDAGGPGDVRPDGEAPRPDPAVNGRGEVRPAPPGAAESGLRPSIVSPSNWEAKFS